MGFQRTNDLGKYLGIKLHHHRVNIQTYNYVIDKAQQKLTAWKSRTLSFACRVILTKYVIIAMPMYMMQTNFIFRNVCNKLDQMCRNFLWGDLGEDKKSSLGGLVIYLNAKTAKGLGFEES